MAPYPDSDPFRPSWAGGPAVVPAAMVASDLINAKEDLLNDYKIDILVNDSGCDIVSKVLSNMSYGLFFSGKNVVGIIGPGCSEATLAIAPLISNDRLSLLQIAASASSPALTNTSLYPNTFRPIVSSLGIVDTYVELIRQKNYDHVGVLYESERPFQTTVYSHFEQALHKEGVKVTSFGLINVQFPVDDIRMQTRIIFVFASADFVRNLLCFAYRERFMYPNYQFIFSERRPNNLLRDVSLELDGKLYSCSVDDMKHSVVGMVFNTFRLTRQDRDTLTDAGISYNEFSRVYEEAHTAHLAMLGLDETITTEHNSNYFDAAWALALSLNNSLPRLKEKGLSLSTYTYQMPEITSILREELLKLSFEGMRGRVEFSEKTHDGANVTIIDIYQVLNASTADIGMVGYYDPLSDDPLVLFPNATILLRADFELDYTSPPVFLGVLVMIAVSLLFIILLVCQGANVIWGEHKTVKAASPNLSNLVFSGCYLALVSAVVYTNAFVFLRIADNSNLVVPIHCSALQWTGTMTYSLVFGTLCAKRWRIYRIFSDFSTTTVKHLGDKVLLSIALTPLAIDIIVNILWNLIDPWQFSIKYGSAGLMAVATCKTNHEPVWALCVGVPKGVLTIVVLYLTTVTRRIHKKEFRQTKSINILIYCLLILTGIFLPLFFILQLTVKMWTVSLSYVSFCLFDLAFVVLCIVLVLLPPLITPMKEKFLRNSHKENPPRLVRTKHIRHHR